MANLLLMARSGGLDGALNQTGQFYQTNFTKALLFLTDGSYLEARAAQQNLLGSQWGMMNETGNFPGQAWLWLYTFWYQVPPFSTSDNADAQIWGIMGILSLLVRADPVHPGRAVDPALDPALQADLARLLPRSARRRTRPRRALTSRASAKRAAAKSRSSIVCAADICVRIRAVPRGTTGNEKLTA